MTSLAPSRSSGQKSPKQKPFRLPFRTLRPQPPRRDFGGRPPLNVWPGGGEEPDPEPRPEFVPTHLFGSPTFGCTGFLLVRARS